MADTVYTEFEYQYGHGDNLRVRKMTRGTESVVSIGTRSQKVYLTPEQAKETIVALVHFVEESVLG